MTDNTVDDGTIELIGGDAVIRFTRQYPNSIDDVWDALTNPQRLAQWWLPFDADITIELVEGGDYILRGKGEGMPTLSWKVLRAESPHLLVHTHVDPGVGRADVEDIDPLGDARLNEQHGLDEFCDVQIGLPLRPVAEHVEMVGIRAQAADEVENRAVGRGQSDHIGKAEQQGSTQELLHRRGDHRF